MINYSKWNDPKKYQRMTAELVNYEIPEKAIFAADADEKIVHTDTPYCMEELEKLKECLDEIDVAVIEAVAVSKYLTSLQIYEYITLQGFDIKRERLRKRILKLMKHRLIQEYEAVNEKAVHALKFYELDYFGYMLAVENGVTFHMGNRYMSHVKKRARGIAEDQPSDIKRILVGNQIVLGLLMSNAKIERFGIMETVRAVTPDYFVYGGYLLRTAANVRINSESVLIYEVVRDLPYAYEKLKNKVERYYKLVNSENYLVENHHGDNAYPQMVICGESYEHNKKIVEYLKNHDLWCEEDPILFTEDLLNVKNSLVSIYALDENYEQTWYEIPSREQC